MLQQQILGLPSGPQLWDQEVLWAFEDAAAGGDVTAPTLSSPTGTYNGPTAANGSVSTDEANGILYWVVTESATKPSVAQIQAGQDNTGSAAPADGSQAVSETGVQEVSASALVAETTYYFHFQHQDAATNDSTVVTSSSFTTPAAPAAGGSFKTSRSRAPHRFGVRVP